MRGDARPFALVGDWAGGGAIVGSEPLRVVGARDDPFDAARRAAESRRATARASAAAGSATSATGSARRVERLPPPPPRPVPLPDVAPRLLRPRAAPGRRRALVVRGARTTARDCRALERLRARLAARAASRARAALGRVRARAPGAAPATWPRVADCVERIAAGELFQANLCLRLEARVRRATPLDLFAAAAAALEPRHARASSTGRGAASRSLSPELFLRRRGRDGASRAPIKGTAPRDGRAPRRCAALARRTAPRT